MVFTLGATSDVVRQGDVQACSGLASTLSVEDATAIEDSAQVSFIMVQHSRIILGVWSSLSSSTHSQLSFTVPTAKNVKHVARHGLQVVGGPPAPLLPSRGVIE